MEHDNNTNGFRNNVRFTHYRFIEEDNRISLKPSFLIKREHGDCSNVSCRGGSTTAEIIFDDQIFVGEANCSLKDNFCKRIGREIAYGRAMKNVCRAHSSVG